MLIMTVYARCELSNKDKMEKEENERWEAKQKNRTT